MTLPPNDTIAAIATAPGRGGIGIIRLSGAKALSIGEQICQKHLNPRFATYTPFFDQQQIIDQGIALYFPNPHSFTGEDCVELQGHGGPVVLDMLLQHCLSLGARLARPGEFSERAFLNDKIDLAQAEAIADLIDASSQQSARNAINSLQGVFSKKITALVESLIQLRIYVEAAIDFPEEEIDFLNDGKIATDLTAIQQQLKHIIAESQQGVILREGLRVAIAGRPNAGKSSLLNALAEKDCAIVTPIAGTTRDVLREYIHLDGLPLHLIDTAGLRSNADEVEQIGIERAQQEFAQADAVLLVVDSAEYHDLTLQNLWPSDVGKMPDAKKITIIANKTDLSGLSENPQSVQNSTPVFYLSIKEETGLPQLKDHLKSLAGYQGAGEGGFTARRRHLDALKKAQQQLNNASAQLASGAGELLAEDLRVAQQSLGEITGKVSPDALLGRIFSSFCIGK